MEIEEMITLWGEMSKEMEKQKKLTDSLIIKMIRTNYRNKISKILIPEIMGTTVCLAEILFILFNYQKLNPWYLLVCGFVSVCILFVLSILSIKTINSIRSVHISDKNYKQTLLEYSRSKIQFVHIQKLGFYLGAILMIVILPVMGQLISGKNLFIETRLWIWYTVGFPFFYMFSKWVFKRYNKFIAEAENVLKELEG
jgi:hypothetical protein